MELVSLGTAAVIAAGLVIRTWLQAHYLDRRHARECGLVRDLARTPVETPEEPARTKEPQGSRTAGQAP